ncbi:SRPBCC family protein [Streptomyces sulphureus]|uniref:SRPBCC family protein n=1 Tax=Streptomyces sulphureus TaxID=47758 RepID=UPI00068759CB|nr:SRPBCC family protein [Streptomyces sulphureus]
MDAYATSETSDAHTLFRVRVETPVQAPPAQVYAVVSDLPRSGEWSAECTGGDWVSGSPGAVGSVFEGRNHRTEEEVPWAPVVRGNWRTHAEVTTAEPGARFHWAMRDSAERLQESVWGFDIAPAPDGSTLAHHFRMGAPTEGIQGITAGMDTAQRERFFAEWGEKLEREMGETLRRLKSVIEKGG